MKKDTNNVTHDTEKVNQPSRFESALRDYETAYAAGDYGKQLQTLAAAIAYSVVAKCSDPQRKATDEKHTAHMTAKADGVTVYAATTDETTYNSGVSPVMQQLRRDIAASLSILDNVRKAAAAATRATLTADGDPVTVTADKGADKALSALMRQTIGDGMDVVQTAALAIVEQSADHADTAPGWMEKPYTIRRLSRRVYIRMDDSAAYTDDVTTPIQEAYRAARRAVASSAAVTIDPSSKYTYIDAETADGMDAIYYRLGRYADMGGYAVRGGSCMAGAPSGIRLSTDGLYTGDAQTARDADAILSRLNLSARQASVLRLRMQGHGKKAIATALGIDPNNVARTLKQVQKRCIDIGFTPDGGDAE